MYERAVEDESDVKNLFLEDVADAMITAINLLSGRSWLNSVFTVQQYNTECITCRNHVGMRLVIRFHPHALMHTRDLFPPLSSGISSSSFSSFALSHQPPGRREG